MAEQKSTPTQALAGKYAEIGGCHVWQRATNSRGYGVVWYDGRLRLAHRVAFRAAHGRWPDADSVTDHVCNNKRCVNADHLRELTNWQNVRRAVKVGTPEVEAKREGWRRANQRRRNYSPSYQVERA